MPRLHQSDVRVRARQGETKRASVNGLRLPVAVRTCVWSAHLHARALVYISALMLVLMCVLVFAGLLV